MNFFYLADKDGSGTLTKTECRRLLVDSFNAKVSDNVFEKLFKVGKIRNYFDHLVRVLFQEADKSGEGLLTSEEFIDFFRLFIRRQDLFKIMKK
jgi:Ca2+-binding EF-hand superfamily protein